MRTLFPIAVLCVGLAACGAGGGGSGDPMPPPPPPPPSPASLALTIGGLPADANVFDPAPAQAAGDTRIWMSYSHVTTTTVDPRFLDVNTRLASSIDGGASWQDSGGFITPAQTTTAPAPHSAKPALWTHEVSRLAYDPHAAGGQWLLLWHRYIAAFDPVAPLRLFEHGWIGLKIATTPAGLAIAPERKLFVGSGYSNVNDSVLGAPEFRLHQLFPGSARLGSCLVFTEPAVLVTGAGIYVTLKCATGTSAGKISSLRCDHAFSAGSCSYLGDFVSDSEATALNASWNGFSAPELVATASSNFLIVSPTQGSADVYRGCLVMRVSSLDTATVARSAGAPLVETTIAPSGDFNGACGYAAGLTASGVIVGQATFGASLSFRLMGTRVSPPN